MLYSKQAKSIFQYRVDLLNAVRHRVRLRRERERLKGIEDESKRDLAMRLNEAAYKRCAARISHVKKCIAMKKAATRAA